MEKVKYFRYLLVFVISSALLISCQKEKPEVNTSTVESVFLEENINIPGLDVALDARDCNSGSLATNTFYGPVVQMGNGQIRSWVKIKRANHQPIALGVAFTAGAFNNLPADPMNFPANTFVLQLHQKARAVTPFDHITINWEPEGHEPPGIYDVPHFDIHFYKTTIAEQLAIGPLPTAPPPTGYLPASYVIEGATVPQMGTHWLDPASPELPPTSLPFTHTFIYGSNNGNTIFLEPMITRAFFLSGDAVSKAIPQPLYFAPSNTNYPDNYIIWKNAANGRHYVALSGFNLR